MKRLMMTLALAVMACGCTEKRSADTTIQESVDPPDLDNGLSSWNTPSSEYGQWCYRAIRIVKAPSGKYVPELDMNIPWDGVSTNTVSQWEPIFEGDGFSDVKMCRYKIRQTFAIKKGICDAFQSAFSARDAPKTVDIIIPAKTNMPPGYLLQKNQEGEYRAIYEDTKVVLRRYPQDDKTRKKAIARAWGQYDYEYRDTTTGWEDVQ